MRLRKYRAKNNARAITKPKIFDRFTRGSDVPDIGSGLGLAIAKKIIELHDGSLLIESSKKGTIVKLVLPLQ